MERTMWRRVGVAFAAASLALVSGCASAQSSAPADTKANSNTTTAPPATANSAIAPTSVRVGTALAAAAALPVKGRAPKTGYSRSKFGKSWVDVDRNGCDTRNDILRAQLTNKSMKNSCKVLSGVLRDPYTNTSITFVYGGRSEVDIDHMVALSDAWQKGAANWTYAKRVAFANDPLGLQSTGSALNRRKGDGDTATWLPPNKSYRCTYVARQVAMKKKYQLWVTKAEQNAMITVLSKCATLPLPNPGSQPTIAANTGG